MSGVGDDVGEGIGDGVGDDVGDGIGLPLSASVELSNTFFAVRSRWMITPRACARGKVIDRVVVVSTKIAISRDVGI